MYGWENSGTNEDAVKKASDSNTHTVFISLSISNDSAFYLTDYESCLNMQWITGLWSDFICALHKKDRCGVSCGRSQEAASSAGEGGLDKLVLYFQTSLSLELLLVPSSVAGLTWGSAALGETHLNFIPIPRQSINHFFFKENVMKKKMLRMMYNYYIHGEVFWCHHFEQ